MIYKFNIEEDWKDLKKIRLRKDGAPYASDRKTQYKNLDAFGRWAVKVFKNDHKEPLSSDEIFYLPSIRMHKDNIEILRNRLSAMSFFAYAPTEDNTLNLNQISIKNSVTKKV